MTELLNTDGSLTDPYRNFIMLSRYARWNEELGRRETWTETVDRYCDFMLNHLASLGYTPPGSLMSEIRHAIKNHKVFPSMRALMTAGPALERSHIAGYNCSYLPVKDTKAFSEAVFILMNGTGLGYSVESEYVNQIPTLPEYFAPGVVTFIVEDSKEGWASCVNYVTTSLWQGIIPNVSYDLIRPKGARLKTFGGRASGPEPLKKLVEFITSTCLKASGRQLTTTEVHDIMCMIGDVVVSGGVRRSALISLSDLNDTEMATAKSGEWWIDNGQRALANNSAVFDASCSRNDFDQNWNALVQSGSGERGIFNRYAAQNQAATRGTRSVDREYGVNPCGEILLRPYEFCNLTTIVVEPDDTPDKLADKVRLATVLGTWQATLTDFPYIRPEWAENVKEERLLGVSMTGIYGHSVLNGSEGKEKLRELLVGLQMAAENVNADMAEDIGIPRSAAITCIKPEGTTSQGAGTSSGMHPWYDQFYIRTVRQAKTDPISKLMVDAGIPYEEDLMNESNFVFSFPVRAPASALTRNDVGAIEHLELWLEYKTYWCHHNPSITVNVHEAEWDSVREWVWEHLDDMTGVSFLPYSDHTYKQAPYQPITEEQYNDLLQFMPTVNWGDLSFYEIEDTTTGTQELACVAGACEIK